MLYVPSLGSLGDCNVAASILFMNQQMLISTCNGEVSTENAGSEGTSGL